MKVNILVEKVRGFVFFDRKELMKLDILIEELHNCRCFDRREHIMKVHILREETNTSSYFVWKNTRLCAKH